MATTVTRKTIVVTTTYTAPEETLTHEDVKALLDEMQAALPGLAQWWADYLNWPYWEAYLLVLEGICGSTQHVWRLGCIPRPYYINKYARQIIGWPDDGGRVPSYARYLARFYCLLEHVAVENKPPKKRERYSRD